MSGRGEVRRVLHVFTVCGRAGTEAVMRFLIAGLRGAGVESEAYFTRDIGGGSLFRELCPVHFLEEKPLAAVLEGGRFDAVIAVTSTITMDVPRVLRECGFGGAVLAACHGDYVTGWNRGNADAVVALSEHWASRIRPYTDLPVEVIGNPIDLVRFSPPSSVAGGRRVLGWVGRMADANKRPELLRAVMAALPEEEYVFHAADTDSGQDARAMFGELASRLGRYGHVPYSEMPGFYRDVAASGGALLFTSLREAFPMGVLEAMASGCPVVVPAAWGSAEIVEHGRSGLIYPPEAGLEGILSCIRELRDPALWRRIAAGARARAEERYSLGAVTGRYLELLRAARVGPRAGSAGYRLRWAARSAAFYARRPPPAVSLYRPRRAAEALERAVAAQRSGRRAQARAALLEALRLFPLLYLKPWRAKFLLRALLFPS